MCYELKVAEPRADVWMASLYCSLVDTRNSEEQYTVIAEINGHTLSRTYITGKVQATGSNFRTLKVKNTPKEKTRWGDREDH